MRHGTPYLFDQGEDQVLLNQATGDRCCYSSDSQKSSSNLASSYSVATYELGQVIISAIGQGRQIGKGCPGN